ncbi:hypothetical protein WMC41_16130 [Shinella yambaruensis]|uniref:hypothetical protein n=1 Tax=Shinella yambaruensis TaxID=415996 RepID=UPI003D793547
MTKTAATKLDDAFGTARSCLHAMRLMTETIFQGSGKDYCSLLTMIDGAERAINDAQAVADTLLEDRRC